MKRLFSFLFGRLGLGLFRGYGGGRLLALLSVIPALGCWGLPVAAAGETASGASDPAYIPSILLVDDDEEASRLMDMGVIIWHRRAGMALAAVPVGLQLPAGMRAESGGTGHRRMPRPAVPALDVAKRWFGASDILSGTGLPQAYTGRGVVTGFCDTGFDPNHINFLDPSGKSRVKRLVCYDETAGKRILLDTPEEIAAWTTDSDSGYHGTHVAGIMAGSYDADGFGGMAPGSEIVATTTTLYDAGILAACEDIIAYADSVGRPAVINLSIGSSNGPRDGSTLFNRYLSLLGREAIIFIAAGNEGASDNTYRARFTADHPDWRVILYGYDWIHYHITGMTDAWSHDDSPVGFRLRVYDDDTGQSVYESDVFGPDSREFEISLSTARDPQLGKFMTGEVYARGYVSPFNGRHVTEIEYDLTSTASAAISDGKWARYHPALEFVGDPGVCADITCDSYMSQFVRWPGYPAPDSSLCISDLATGENVVVVGMYNNKARIPQLSGTDRVFDIEPFTVNAGSGYGVSGKGETLPHTVAPGGGVVSSSNRFFTLAHPDYVARMNVAVEAEGETYYWGSDIGTSMATPYVAGVVATWLEADPTLTVTDVLRVLEATNTLDVPDPGNPRHGGGWLRPVEGLRRVLENVGTGTLRDDSSPLRIVAAGDVVEVRNPGCAEVTVEIHNAAGLRLMVLPPSSSPLIRSDISHLPPGVYFITARTPGAPPATLRLLR